MSEPYVNNNQLDSNQTVTLREFAKICPTAKNRYNEEDSVELISQRLTRDRRNAVPLSPDEFATMIDLLKGKMELSFLRARGLHLVIGELSPENFDEFRHKLSESQYASFLKAYDMAPNVQNNSPPSLFFNQDHLVELELERQAIQDYTQRMQMSR
ncbi:hypothetical protein L3V83_09775 [Thiotrichales bacterium 19X7-9]|nr:hypothetical protein [Thiotrichales bacterium 19X7-9]